MISSVLALQRRKKCDFSRARLVAPVITSSFATETSLALTDFEIAASSGLSIRALLNKAWQPAAPGKTNNSGLIRDLTLPIPFAAGQGLLYQLSKLSP